MSVPVVEVRHVGMVMDERRMAVRVAVRLAGRLTTPTAIRQAAPTTGEVEAFPENGAVAKSAASPAAPSRRSA